MSQEDQDAQVLHQAFTEGRYQGRQRWAAEPLKYMCTVREKYQGNRQEAFYRQVVEMYQAGYDGLTYVPAQYQ
jgi:hypothetical protein